MEVLFSCCFLEKHSEVPGESLDFDNFRSPDVEDGLGIY